MNVGRTILVSLVVSEQIPLYLDPRITLRVSQCSALGDDSICLLDDIRELPLSLTVHRALLVTHSSVISKSWG